MFVDNPAAFAEPGPVADTDAHATTLYHVSPREERDSILTHGLDRMRSDREYSSLVCDYPSGNYFHAAIDLAVAWHDNIAAEGLDCDIWAVDVTALEVRHDPHDLSDTFDYYFYTTATVTPDKLTLTDPASHEEWR